MGITIHYAGRASSEESIEALFEQSIEMGKEFGWLGTVPERSLRREQGISFLPHAECEPVHLWFTPTRRFSDFCKTQFAGPAVHRQVLEFFRRLEPHYSKLVIYDESEDFEVEGDSERLERAFEIALEHIKQGLADHPGCEMQVRLPSGRIADLIE